ncbi:MAG: HlyC/CorC family transporter [Planctomycetes bacterium]|nr:HlyC/CorC family transporter [Planctomycetota bacterium]
MLLLLVCSAFFSGSETAFFNLSKRQINLFKRSDHKLQRLTAKLLMDPNKLLGTLSLGNMVVNILFYAVSSIIIVHIRNQSGVTAAAIMVFITFLAVVLFGEILPKSIAFANPRSISITASLPLFFLIKILSPTLKFFSFFFVNPTIRLLIGPHKKTSAITADDFKSLIDSSRKQGFISSDENKLLSEVIELGFLKVRHVMKPRVDMTLCSIKDPNEKIRQLMLNNHLTKIAVYANEFDNITGLIHLRDLLLSPDQAIDKLVKPVQFVPEQKNIESLLEFFRKTATDTAIVVDEYGGLAGSVRLEDIAEELIGPIETSSQQIEQISPFNYRLSGDLSIHDWAETFDIEAIEDRVSTIGGLVTALLGKIPQESDSVDMKNLKFTVESVKKHRIQTLLLTFKPLENDK